MTDPTGAVAQTYKYEPYGLLRSSSGSVTNPFRFTGGYRTGSGFGEMYKLGARYYDPSIGRWTQPDPIDQPGDLREGNRYAYVADNPINLLDPSGMRYCTMQTCYDRPDCSGEGGYPGIPKCRKRPDPVLSTVVGCGTGAISSAIRRPSLISAGAGCLLGGVRGAAINPDEAE